ncbi:MAG: ScpA family protein [Patescibacteria group bacterium]
MQTNTYIVKTEHFEGPLDVLLSLIEKRKLLINQVSLSMVTEEFMRFIEELQDPIFIKEKTSFVAIASILLLIKARSLLPTLTVTEEETEDIESLEKRLKALEFVRGISKKIEAQYGKKIIYNQGNFKKDICIFAPSKDISIANIQEAVLRVLHKLPKPDPKMPEAKIRTVVSIEEMMNTLTTRIQRAINGTFSQFAKSTAAGADPKEAKQHVVVSFLALLELVKQNMIFVSQEQMFDEIDIKSVTNNEQ